MERNHERSGIPKFETGEPIEVLADRKIGSQACYARIVQAVSRPVARELARPSSRSQRNALPFSPQGDRTLAGVVVRRDQQALTIRTRSGEETMLLRPDTRYLNDGVRIEPSELSVNTRVFVRAGEDIYGHLEAYQVMWGEILKVP